MSSITRSQKLATASPSALMSRWNFVFTSFENIKAHFSSLKTPFSLNESASSPYVFIIDKDLNLRGRNDDEDMGFLYAFDARSVAQINKKMIDDAKENSKELLKKYNEKYKIIRYLISIFFDDKKIKNYLTG